MSIRHIALGHSSGGKKNSKKRAIVAEQQLGVFSYLSPEQQIPHNQPLRHIRVRTDEALREWKQEGFLVRGLFSAARLGAEGRRGTIPGL